MDISKFSHLVVIEEASRRLTIFRLSENGEKSLYTQIDLPPKKADEDKSAYEKFTHDLGENILLDSPSARRLLGL